MEITEITISIGYKKRNEENNMIRHDQEITTYLRNKEENNRKSKKIIYNMKRNLKKAINIYKGRIWRTRKIIN